MNNLFPKAANSNVVKLQRTARRYSLLSAASAKALIFSATSLVLIMATPREAVAQTTYYWDSNGATAGFGSTAGTWGTSSFWSTDAAGTSATANSTITTADTVNFGTATLNYNNATVTGPSVAQGFLNMNFGANQTTALTISGGTLNLAANSTITQNSATRTMTISSVLQGSGSALIKDGTGALTLSGNNTFTGGLTVQGNSTLTLQNANAAGTGTISLKTTQTGTTSALIVSGGVTVANAISIDPTVGRQNISSSGNGNNSLTGGITIVGNSANTTIIQNNQTSGNLTVSGGISAAAYTSTISLRGTNAALFNGAMTLASTGTLEHQGTANWTLNTAGSTYATVALRNAGNFILGADNALATGARIDFLSGNTSTGAIDLNGFNQTVTGIAGLAPATGNGGIITNNGSSNSTLTLNGTVNRTYSGTITDGSTNKISLIKAGTFTQTLNGNSTYSGDTLVSGGNLTLGTNLAIQNSAIDTSGSGNVTLASGVTTPTIGGLSGSKNLSSVITGNYTAVTSLTLNPGTGATKTYSGNITNGAAGMTLTKTGNGTQILSGTNTYTGNTTVSAGTLLINGSTSASSAVSVNGGTLGGNGTIAGSVTVNSGGTLSPGNSPGSLTVGSLTLNAGSKTIAEFAASATPAGAGSTFDTIIIQSGGSLIYGGELRLTFDGAVADSTTPFGIFNLGALVPTGSFASVNIYKSIGTPVLVGALTNNSGVWSGTYDLGFGGGSQNFTFTEATGALVVPEPSTWALLTAGLVVAVILRRRKLRQTT